MRLPTIFQLSLCVILLIQPFAAIAFETDQYNLSPEPLADIGDEFTQHVEQNLRKALEKVNSKISDRRLCLEKKNENRSSLNCSSQKKEKAQLDYLQSEDVVAKELYNLLGTGTFPLTKSENWIKSHQFNAQPSRYKTSYSNSTFLTAPFNYLTISPTVKMYETEFGTDKIAHFFQQGYTYFRIYQRALKAGRTVEEANKKAISWGQKTERTYYGSMVSGVYSNADLAANYVGMRFYQNLTGEISIGENIRPPILQLVDGVWKINETIDLNKSLLKPFISAHLNEALNSSSFMVAFGFRSVVRRVVRKKSCPQWRERFPDFSKSGLSKTSEALKLWHGEDYGFTDSKHFVKLADTCFDENGKFIEQTD